MDNPKLLLLDTARERLDHAKKAADEASARYEEVDALLKALQKNKEEALGNLKKADAAWKAVQDMVQVIELEVDGEKRSDGGSKKRAVTPTEQLDNAPTKTPRLHVDMSKLTSIKSILVSGCGIDSANGTYKKLVGFEGDYPKYCHKGKWEGDDARFVIFHSALLGWVLAATKTMGRDCAVLYKCKIKDDPFNNPWDSHPGHNPPPKFEVKLFCK